MEGKSALGEALSDTWQRSIFNALDGKVYGLARHNWTTAEVTTGVVLLACVKSQPLRVGISSGVDKGMVRHSATDGCKALLPCFWGGLSNLHVECRGPSTLERKAKIAPDLGLGLVPHSDRIQRLGGHEDIAC